MLFSVFTPTHRPDHIAEAYDSLCAQTCADREWVIVPNGAAATVPDRLGSDPRIRVLPAPDDIAALGIGALKRFACERCSGDYLVELDHDDLLASGALACIADAAQRTGAGFLYSDFANFRADGTCEVYGGSYGWESYPVVCEERSYTAMRSFETDASALHLIFFAPNHVRVWSREAYARAGAHDAALGVVDDHDLICRTYLAGVMFHHIPECLYLYRLLPEGQNTYVQRNAEIQQRQQEISSRYSTDGRGAFQDPTHVSFWNLNSFWYYTRRQQAQYVPGLKCRFQGTRIWQTFPTEWHKTHNIPYVYADLVALKGQRQPGSCEI